jgi:hypothetical protein
VIAVIRISSQHCGKTALRVALTAALAFAAAPAPAQDEIARHWQALTRIDVDAAYQMLREDHPGSVEEVGDAAFRARLESAYAAARERAARIASVNGYFATLAAFATAMGDKHIWSRPLLSPLTVDWAGIVIARRGNDWVVADEDRAAESESLRGARLASCDGMPADTLAAQRLGTYRAIWSVGAQRIAAAPLLLVDDGNPFLTRPARCTFVLEGQTREIALAWRTIRRTELTPRIAQAVRRGQPGFGVRPVGEGYWIALQSLNEQAGPVVEAVRAQAEAIRQAPFVVFDLRGNSGGNSLYGDQIAAALLGRDSAPSAGGGGNCNTVWRLSARNLRDLDRLQREILARMGPEQGAFFALAYRNAVAARAAGRNFSGPVSCPAADAPAAPAFSGRVILLTDHACFSSCLIVTDRFRRLGALHVGEETDAATRYFEVREDRLPSGLSMFSTLQALSPGSPAQIGPFTPEISYDGDISDTAALEAWIATIARRSAT